ncbi:MAG: hypothetical protein LBT60_04650 [Oscillospiraceae bacterium]|jgi:hypothetical protein|nr:hypothetical protein [Oscillospiraceae bacterium]
MSESAKTMQAAYDPEGEKKLKWSAFTEGQLTEFFTLYDLEKLTAEDGKGNKAKLSRTKDNGIKLEQSSTTIL